MKKQLPFSFLAKREQNDSDIIDIIDLDDIVDTETLKRRKKIATVSILALAIVLLVAIVLGITSSNKEQNTVVDDGVNVVDNVIDDEEKTSDSANSGDDTYPFSESIELDDPDKHVLTVKVDISAYFSDLKSLLEEHYQTEVKAIKLYSCLNGESTIQYLVWYDNSSTEHMDQFASISITQYLQGKADTWSCGEFTSGFSGGAFIIYEK